MGESIVIDDEVTLTVLSIKGKQVRIGIDAPSHVAVHRQEIYDKLKAEQGEDASMPALRSAAGSEITTPASEDSNTPDN